MSLVGVPLELRDIEVRRIVKAAALATIGIDATIADVAVAGKDGCAICVVARRWAVVLGEAVLLHEAAAADAVRSILGDSQPNSKYVERAKTKISLG